MSDESIRERLWRQLSRRGDTGSARRAPAPDAEAIARREQVFERLGRRSGRSVQPEPAPPAVGGPGSAAAPRDLERTPLGSLSRTARFAPDHRHGHENLENLFDVALDRIAERARDERFRGVDLTRAVFFDTETTGLSGGAGTYVFLVGLMRWDGEHFELWQGFLPHPSEERILLAEVAQRIAAADVLVSFFGKSFDRHRLEDKMRLHGVAPPFEAVAHLDLYHPLRRAHRGQFEDCRLKTLERELAGFARPDDLPGRFAPEAWFDFLAGRPHRLEGVFRHNRDDVLSLAALLCALGR